MELSLIYEKKKNKKANHLGAVFSFPLFFFQFQVLILFFADLMWFQLTQGLTMFHCRQTRPCLVDSHPTVDGVCHTTLNANARYAKLDFFNLFFKRGRHGILK